METERTELEKTLEQLRQLKQEINSDHDKLVTYLDRVGIRADYIVNKEIERFEQLEHYLDKMEDKPLRLV